MVHFIHNFNNGNNYTVELNHYEVIVVAFHVEEIISLQTRILFNSLVLSSNQEAKITLCSCTGKTVERNDRKP